MICFARPLLAKNQSAMVKEPGFAGYDNDVAIAEAEPFSVALKDPGREWIFVPREGHGLAETGRRIDSLDRLRRDHEHRAGGP